MAKQKADPPGTRTQGGKKYIPPAPMKRGAVRGQAGSYSQEYDPAGVPKEMQETLKPRKISQRKPAKKRRGY